MTVTYTNTEREREREGVGGGGWGREKGPEREKKNRLLKIFNCDDCLVMKEEISVCFLFI